MKGMRKLRTIGGLAASLLAVAACSNPGQGPTATNYMELPAESVMYGMSHRMSSNGVRSAVLESDTVYQLSESTRWDLFGVNLVTYDETGGERAVVTSETGELFTDTERMIARGNVVLIVDGGEHRIETEELHYDPSTRRLWSEVATRYRRGNGAWAVGTGFTADDAFQNVRVQNLSGTAPGTTIEF
jgi:LPS export ABC transporter protein LptC